MRSKGDTMVARVARAARDLGAQPYAADAIAWLVWLVVAVVIVVRYFL